MMSSICSADLVSNLHNVVEEGSMDPIESTRHMSI